MRAKIINIINNFPELGVHVQLICEDSVFRKVDLHPTNVQLKNGTRVWLSPKTLRYPRGADNIDCCEEATLLDVKRIQVFEFSRVEEQECCLHSENSGL